MRQKESASDRKRNRISARVGKRQICRRHWHRALSSLAEPWQLLVSPTAPACTQVASVLASEEPCSISPGLGAELLRSASLFQMMF